ncbi:unnamed protein product [Mesocestoides corti]|uniref:GSKIP domain-containing protein n=1 Tax=Mesocestoides corti TaxID=53468 RepID=A0A0R3UGT7_MESCO|nr:unnamed protein product [Mesocestoides corti]
MMSDSFVDHLTASDGEKLCSIEAKAAVKETAFGVRDIRIAEALPFSDSLAYLNLTTLEGERLCVEISVEGFRPVGILQKWVAIVYFNIFVDAARVEFAALDCPLLTGLLIGLFVVLKSYDDVIGPVPPPPSHEGAGSHVDGSGTKGDEATPQRSREDAKPAVAETYETIYALLSARSAGFRHRFSEKLAERLAELQSETN